MCDLSDVTRFEDLKIPLRVVATDFYSGESIVFDSGPLLPALKASMSIPGVFVPVEHDGRSLQVEAAAPKLKERLKAV